MSQETHRSWPSKSSWSPEFWRPYVLAIWRQSGSTLSSSKPALLIPWGIYLLRQRWGCWRFKIIWKGHRNVGGLSLIRFVSQRICRYIHMHISLYMYIIFYIYIYDIMIIVIMMIIIRCVSNCPWCNRRNTASRQEVWLAIRLL